MHLPSSAWAFAPFVVVAAATIATRTYRAFRPLARRFCPGPPPSLTSRFWPLRWFRNSACWYDLTGLRPAPDGSITCPECGRRLHTVAQALFHTRRWRLARLGLVLTLAAALPIQTRFVRTWRWVKWIPTTALVAAERVCGPSLPLALQRQVETRVDTQVLDPEEARVLIPALIRDLKADGVNGNAERAMWLLPQLGNDALAALEAALRSPDWQQRQLAAHVLRGQPGLTPCDDLLRVTVEGLRSDDLPYERPDPSALRHYGHFTDVRNARGGFVYLLGFPDMIEPFIEPGLTSEDHQQRLLCAGLAGGAHLSRLIPKAAPILIEHLRANRVPEDARFAGAALFRFGPEVAPWLEPLTNSDDRQARAIARRILSDFVQEPVPARFLSANQTNAGINSANYDPSHEFFKDGTWWLR